jgi:hypothetical protein
MEIQGTISPIFLSTARKYQIKETDVQTPTVPVPIQNPIWILNVCLLVLEVQYRLEGSEGPRLGRYSGFGNPLFKNPAYFFFGYASSLLINKLNPDI